MTVPARETPPGAPAGDRRWGAFGVSVSFGRTLALDNVSLVVARGEVTAVVGGDGAGKTTLLRVLSGALKPAAGSVHGPGAPRTGYLPASSGMYPDLTVAENLSFRASAYRMPAPAARVRAGELLAEAGLAGARDRLAGNLSGGMRVKLGVIAALLHRPDLLVLDEPTTGIDPVSRSGLWQLIAGAAAGGAAVVLATTYLDDAQRAGSVLVLDGGCQLAAGTPEEIVAAMPGTLRSAAARPAGQARRLSWRRGTAWRVWYPARGQRAGDPVEPDLPDAVMVASLQREAAAGGVPSADDRAGAQETAAGVVSLAAGAPSTAGASAARPIAECVALTRRFGDFTAVRDVTMEVRPGEIVGLLGANGAGKTTVIRMLLGLLPPSAGRVMLLGEPPSRRTRSRIGYVPQGLGLYDDLTAAENMAFAAAVFGAAALGRSPATLPADLFSVPGAQEVPAAAPGRPARGLPVGRLPLGTQRRIAFAQALAHRPELLLLDEPTSGVDPLGRARLWETIGDVARDGVGVLVSTHYMEEAQQCDRLIVMADGAVVAAGTAAQIVGDMQVTVVHAASWAVAFRRLADAGLAVALSGRSLRVPGATPARVTEVLAGPSGRLADDTDVSQAPATLEERFFDLVLRDSRDRLTA